MLLTPFPVCENQLTTPLMQSHSNSGQGLLTEECNTHVNENNCRANIFCIEIKILPSFVCLTFDKYFGFIFVVTS